MCRVLRTLPKTFFSHMKFAIGERVYTKRIGSEWTKSEILLHRIGSNNEDEYLIHFDGFNRRLDEWVHEGRVMSVEDHQASHEVLNGFGTEENTNKKMTRNQRRKFNEMNHIQKSLADLDPITAALEIDYAERTKIKYINKLILGAYEIETWYYSPYPNEYEKLSVIFVCEMCLKYMALEKCYIDHKEECNYKTPPGHKIYEDDNLQVYEIDGFHNKLFCQNLCLLAKLFFDHKTLYFDVAMFYFYVLYEFDGTNYHIASYFSKEKVSIDNFNVSCILTFPQYQRKGYGKFMISLSYELCKNQNTTGTPERPLSDLGHASYRSYWAYTILDFLRSCGSAVVTITDISDSTAIEKRDVIETLQLLNLLKYWKGNNMSCFSSKKIDKYIKSGYCKPPRLFVDPKKLTL